MNNGIKDSNKPADSREYDSLNNNNDFERSDSKSKNISGKNEKNKRTIITEMVLDTSKGGSSVGSLRVKSFINKKLSSNLGLVDKKESRKSNLFNIKRTSKSLNAPAKLNLEDYELDK